MRTLRLLGGMITRPLATLRAIASAGPDGGAPVWPPLALYLFVVALIQLKVLARLFFLLDEGGSTIGKRIREAVVDDVDTDAALLAVTVAVLALLARFVAREAVPPLRAAVAGVWLLVPLIVLKCVGGALQAAGVDAWFLPHEAVDSMAVVVDRQVSWLRFAVKSIVSYGPPLVLAALLVASWRRAARDGAAPVATTATRDGRAWAGAGVVGVAFVGLLVAATVSAVRVGDRIRPLQAGDALPEAVMRAIDDKGVTKQKIKLSSFQGKVLVLDFWASWCTPCKRSMPELSKLQDELGPRGLVVLGVNREPREPKEAAAALAQIRPTFASVIDEKFYGDRIGLTTLPTSYVVDKKGVVRHLHLGYTEIDVVRAEVEALLAE